MMTGRRMTPEQRKRFSDWATRELNLEEIMHSGNLRGELSIRQYMPATANVDDVLANLERKQRQRVEVLKAESHARIEAIENTFSRDELFRLAYVPFVIAELVWDYADTVIIMAQKLGNPATRRLSRVIRSARVEYNRLRHQFIDQKQRDREIENGYVFEDATRRITSQMMLNVKLDIHSEYPDLDECSRDLLLAVYQCHITSRALLLYLDRKSAEVAKRIGRKIGKMLPPPYYEMDKVIPEFIGDKPASERFRKMMRDYINTFATQIALVEMGDIEYIHN